MAEPLTRQRQAIEHPHAQRPPVNHGTPPSRLVALPMILSEPEEIETWLSEQAKALRGRDLAGHAFNGLRALAGRGVIWSERSG
ncbi:hypothetical protein [Bosea vaviloviae]|uniref:hypothetical protein n=1 Tax=Bosea vaviloviae TaxID=1526658 RepID=UPI0013146191|nr:hypothetical protein [Bosea vaviloviae]